MFIKPSGDDGNEPQQLTTDMPPAPSAESHTQQTDEKYHNDCVGAIRRDLSQQQYAPHKPLSHIGKSEKVQDKSEKQQLPRSQKSPAVSRSENDAKSDLSKRREKQKKAEINSHAQQQLMAVKSATGNGETRLKTLSGNKRENKVHSSSNADCRAHKVKSVVVKPANEADTGSNGKNSFVHDNGCQRSSGTKSDEKIRRAILCSFDEVDCVSLFRVTYSLCCYFYIAVAVALCWLVSWPVTVVK